MKIEDKGENEQKKSIGFKIIGLLTEIEKSEKNVNHISIVDKFVLFSVLGSWYFYEKIKLELSRTGRVSKK